MILKYINITQDLSINANIYLAILWHYRKRKTLNVVICRTLGISEQTGIHIRKELKEKNYISTTKQQYRDLNKYVTKVKIIFLPKATDMYERDIHDFEKTTDLEKRNKTGIEKAFSAVYQDIKKGGIKEF